MRPLVSARASRRTTFCTASGASGGAGRPLALGADPPLTSIDMCLKDVGRKCAELLLGAIDGHPAHGLTIVPCRLVTRASSGPHAAPADSPAGVG
ncbi:MAG TPA: substrate-binding domain-containing protein [Streptosporangiaceae bacterium]|nr:substrate-binding domain-containing protein [Streptosporangiaceae bacterium]